MEARRREHDARERVEDNDRNSDKVQRRSMPQEDDEPARGESVHVGSFSALEE